MYVPNSLKKSENSASRLRIRIVQPGVWTVVPTASIKSSLIHCFYQRPIHIAVKCTLYFAEPHVMLILSTSQAVNHKAYSYRLELLRHWATAAWLSRSSYWSSWRWRQLASSSNNNNRKQKQHQATAQTFIMRPSYRPHYVFCPSVCLFIFLYSTLILRVFPLNYRLSTLGLRRAKTLS